MKKNSSHTYSSSTTMSNRYFFLFTTPLLVGILIFSYVPLLVAAIYSVFSAQGSLVPTQFVGVRNYIDLIGNPDFQTSFITFFTYTVIIVPLTFGFSLSLALLLHSLNRGALFFQACIFLPTACSTIAASIIWKLSIFNGVRFGLANTLLKAVSGHQPIAWLFEAHPPWYWLVIISLRLWLQTGFYVILFSAALRRIDPALYEAAAMDGMHFFYHKFRYIIWPSIQNISFAIITLLTLNAFQAFDEFYNLIGSTNGYPPYARPPLIYLYYVSMGESQDFGHAGAGVILLITAVLLMSSIKYLPRLSLLSTRLYSIKKS